MHHHVTPSTLNGITPSGHARRNRSSYCSECPNRRRQHLLANRAVPDAGAFLRAERHAGREHLWAVVRAGYRHQLLDLHLCLESGAAAHGRRARGL